MSHVTKIETTHTGEVRWVCSCGAQGEPTAPKLVIVAAWAHRTNAKL